MSVDRSNDEFTLDEMSRASRQLTLLSIAGLVTAAGVAVLIARSPDQGVDLASIRQGVACGLVFAAAPIGVLLAHDGTLAAGLGAGMTAAGTVTVSGGNFPAVLMVVCGAPLAWLGWNASEAPRPYVVRQFVISSVALVAATYLVLETGWVTDAIGVVLAAGSVWLSVLWESRKP